MQAVSRVGDDGGYGPPAEATARRLFDRVHGVNFLLLTAHDYRTPRKANMHFIADELVKRGSLRFFSLRYSALSRRKNDPRAFLDASSNRVERHAGAECFLWKVPVHAFNTRRRWLRPLENLAFRSTQAHPPTTLVRWMREADVIFFESGSAILHMALAEKVNPRARRIYIASDDLDVIHVADYVKREFARCAARLTALCLPSRRLAQDMPRSENRFFVPHGIDIDMRERGDPSPYTESSNAVSVGSMLFDRRFFEVVGAALPHVHFHVIGSGLTDRVGLATNVHVYDEMPHEQTLRYIKHADAGIAPYASDRVPAYLVDTSMKLMQYALFGIPAVCPRNVAGDDARRFGYDPQEPASMVAALRAALAAPSVAPPAFLTWAQVTDRLIDPAAFADTRLDGAVA